MHWIAPTERTPLTPHANCGLTQEHSGSILGLMLLRFPEVRLILRGDDYE